MIRLIVNTFLELAILAAAPALSQCPRYSTWMSDSFLLKEIVKNARYEQALLYRAIELTYRAYGNATYTSWIEWQLDGAVVLDDGTLANADEPRPEDALIDLRMGAMYLDLWERTHMDKWRVAATTLRRRLDSQKRNAEGGFWHSVPDYPNIMVIDGTYMALPLYAQHTRLFEPTNITAYTDIVKQFAVLQRHTFNATTRLHYHGYDGSEPLSARRAWADPVTGASPYVWSRGVGWWSMAAVDVLEQLDLVQQVPDIDTEVSIGLDMLRSELRGYLSTVMGGVVAALQQQEDGDGWYLLMDPELAGRPGNYIESSAGAMFVYVLLNSARLGYLDEGAGAEAAQAAAQRAYDGLIARFVVTNATEGWLNWEGSVKNGSLSQSATYEYYTGIPTVENNLNGVGSFILASLEYEAVVDCVEIF